MKKKDNRLNPLHWGLLLVLIGLTLGLSSCVKDRYINVNPSEQTFSYQGGNAVIHVKANCRWHVTVEGEHDWFTLNPTSGRNDGDIALKVLRNTEQFDRSAMITIVSNNGKIKTNVAIVQTKPDISFLTEKIWFMHFYERWDLDYYNQVIEDSYDSWSYDIMNIETENWFFYFLNDSTGYQISTYHLDTAFYQYEYIFYPEYDSLYIDFLTESGDKEDYHVTVNELNARHLVFGDEYLWHRFEKIYTNFVPSSRQTFVVDPKKVRPKPHGPLIQKRR